MPRIRGPRVSAPSVPGPRVAHAAQLALVMAYVHASAEERRALLDAAAAVSVRSATPGLAQAARGLLTLAR
jgi:hypothetical protein